MHGTDDCPCCRTWARVRDEAMARAHAAERETKRLREELERLKAAATQSESNDDPGGTQK